LNISGTIKTVAPDARPAFIPDLESSNTKQFSGFTPKLSAAYKNTSGAGFPFETS